MNTNPKAAKDEKRARRLKRQRKTLVKEMQKDEKLLLDIIYRRPVK